MDDFEGAVLEVDAASRHCRGSQVRAFRDFISRHVSCATGAKFCLFPTDKQELKTHLSQAFNGCECRVNPGQIAFESEVL